MAFAVGALAEIDLHRNAEAHADLEIARTALQGNRQNQPNLLLLLAQAREALASRRSGEARSIAEAARAQAERARAVAWVLEARLGLGEVDMRERPESGRKALQVLAHEARGPGFLLIAQKSR